MPTKSSGLFSIGVPVSAQLRVRWIERATWAVVLDLFLIRCAFRAAPPRGGWDPRVGNVGPSP